METYAQWKQRTGVTDEDEQRYLERRRAGLTRSRIAPEVLRYRANELERMLKMTEGNGEQHTHEETVKDEHTNEDGTVSTEKTETTEAETNGDE